MRKKLTLLLTFVLAFAVSLGVLAGCGKKGADVTVKISKTTLNIEVGKSSTLSATASDGSDIEWTTSDDSIASVNDRGSVTGEKAGVATVTATVKGGTASASCEVTVKEPVIFVFKDADGNAINEVTVDREGDPVKISATASDGSTITSWFSNDEDIATVNDGLITAVREGETKINAVTATGSGEITVKVTDSFTGDKYMITATEVVDKWYYYAREDGGRVVDIRTAEFRGGVVTFEYGEGFNWNSDDTFLAIKKSDIEQSTDDVSKWYELSMDINSSIATSVTVNGTRVDLKEGDNKNVTVSYEQWEHASAIIQFGNGEAGVTPAAMKVVITNVSWKDFTPVTLKAPSYTLSGSSITVTDDNAKGVKQYQIGLFKDGEEKPAFSQLLPDKSGTLNTSTMTENGEYTVKVKAVGNLGYNDSDWSTNNVKYTVNNGDIKYTLTDKPTKDTHGGGAAEALISGRWEYFTITPEGAGCDSAEYDNGTLTFKGTNGWSADSAQLLRHYAQFDVGTELTVTMTLKSSLGGDIMVCGEKVTLVANEEKVVTVTVTQKSGTPTIAIILDTLAPDHATDPVDPWPNKKKDPASMPNGPVEFVVSNVTVAPKA